MFRSWAFQKFSERDICLKAAELQRKANISQRGQKTGPPVMPQFDFGKMLRTFGTLHPTHLPNSSHRKNHLCTHKTESQGTRVSRKRPFTQSPLPRGERDGVRVKGLLSKLMSYRPLSFPLTALFRVFFHRSLGLSFGLRFAF